MKTIGLILNGHRPPHKGHQYMVEFAQAYVDELWIGVCTKPGEAFTPQLRYQWTKELFPNAKVVLCEDMHTYFGGMKDEDPELWKRVALEYMRMKRVDYYFASEDYGPPLAKALGAKYIPIDHSRTTIPVSASQIRSNPMRNWEWIPEVVRPYFAKRVCIIGAEYTGKAELAYQLANRYRTCVVDEYAKTVYDSDKRKFSYEDIELICRGQMASEDSLAKQCNKVLICNTDLLTTYCWSISCFGRFPTNSLRKQLDNREYDLYLFMDTKEVPWKPSNTHKTRDSWEQFSVSIQFALKTRKKNFITLSGSPAKKMKDACLAIDELIS